MRVDNRKRSVIEILDDRVEASLRRMDGLEREGLDHHSEEWQEAFARGRLLCGLLAMARKNYENQP